MFKKVKPMRKITPEQFIKLIQAKEKEQLKKSFKNWLKITVEIFQVHWFVRKYYKPFWIFKILFYCICILLKKPTLK